MYQRFRGFSGTLIVAAAFSCTVCNAWGESADEPTISEVVVTAQKRAERLQDVPIAVTAIAAEALQQSGVNSPVGFQQLVPSMVSMPVAGHYTPFLRGVGSDLNQINQDPDVAMYTDGVYVPSVDAMMQQLLGVERIEVLAGPQGTLYGRNALGGAMNIITLTPTQKTEVSARLSAGNYKFREFSGHVSGGVADNLAMGVYVVAGDSDPYIERVGPEPERNPPQYRYGWRLKGVYTPTDWFKLTGLVEQLRRADTDSSLWRQVAPNALGYKLFGSPYLNEPYKVQAYYGAHNVEASVSTVFKEEVDLGHADFVGVTGYRRLASVNYTDVAATGDPVLLSHSNPIDKSYSQEFQVLSKPDSWINWVGGVYLYYEDGKYNPMASTSQIAFLPYTTINHWSGVKTKSIAAFGQFILPLDRLAPGLSLLGGLRYAHDKKEGQIYDTGELNTGATVLRVPLLTREKSWSKPTPKATLTYKFDNKLLYVTYSKGYKSGAFNLSSATGFGPVDPELLTAYEVGIKLQFANGRLVWNSAAYYYQHDNLQVSVNKFTTSGNGVLLNAAAARMKGIESSLQAAVAAGFTVHGSLSRLNAYYADFKDYPGIDPNTLTGVTVDVTGNTVQRSPKWTVGSGGSYERPLSSGRLSMSADWYYNSGYFFSPQNLDALKQRSYQIVNATLGYTTGSNVEFRIWGTNLSDSHYLNTALGSTTFGINLNDAPPRMYGLSLGYSF